MKVIQHVTDDGVLALRHKLSQLDDAYWRDRSRHKPNMGLNADVGYYFSCARESMPHAIRVDIDRVAPRFEPYELEGWVVNKTPLGGGMPPHIDNEGYFGIGILCLQSHSGSFEWYNDLNQLEKITDKAGQLILFDDTQLVHRVPPVLSERYVVVFLYR